MSLDKIVYYSLETHPGQVFQSAEWCLESNIMMKKHELGIPIWTNHKILKNYEPDPNPEQDLITVTSSKHDSDLTEPTLVSQSPKQTEDEPETLELQPLSAILDQFAPPGNLPDANASSGMDVTVPKRVRRRTNAQKTK